MAGVIAVACGAPGAETGGEAVAGGCPENPPRVISDSFPEPDVRHSRNGVLDTTLRATYSDVEIAGERYRTQNFEGTVPGPLLVVCPGDELNVSLENDLPAYDGATDNDIDEMRPGNVADAAKPIAPGPGQPINLHTHGLHVSPGGDSDNVFLDIAPGEDYRYEYEIPDDHPPGTYWYHPHRHGFVDGQIFAGMVGGILVEGGLDDLPELADIPTRNMVMHYSQLGDDGKVVPAADATDEESQWFINGASQPDIPIRPGEVQRWRIVNAGSDPILPLTLGDGQPFWVLANDGNTLDRMSKRTRVLLGPGERVEVLVQGPKSGRYPLVAEPFTQLEGAPAPKATLAQMVSSGSAVEGEVPVDLALAEQEDLAEAEVDNRHTVVYTKQEIGGNPVFLLNGKVFDPNRVDETMKLGEVSEWTIENPNPEWHTFHIHVNDFQVMSVDGTPATGVTGGGVSDVGPDAVDPADTVRLPPGKTVVIRMRPTDFTGKFVFHCHMTFHEDHGMMGVVEVVD